MGISKYPLFELSPVKVSKYTAIDGMKDVSFSVTIAPYLAQGVNEIIKDVFSKHLTTLYPKYSLGVHLSMDSFSKLHTVVFTIFDVPIHETDQVSEFLSDYINKKFLDKLYESKLAGNSGE